MEAQERDALLADIERIRSVIDVDKEEAERGLLGYLSHEDAPIRVAAAEAVWEYYYLAPVLDRAMRMVREDPDAEVRKAALVALGRVMAEGDIDEIEERAIGDLDPDMDIDPQVYWKTREFLLAAAEDEAIPLDVRRYAVEALGYVGYRPDVAALLYDWYGRPEPDARVSALFAMGLSSSREFKAPILRHLHDADLDLRLVSLRAAGQCGFAEAKADVLAASREEDPRARAAAAEALGGFAGDDVLDRLTELADDPDPDVRAQAEESIETAWDNDEEE